LLLTTGTWHFASPHGFELIVPRFLGSRAFWVRLSGVGELGCAAGLLISRTRRPAAWATAALFVIVFPANIDMAVHAWQGHGSEVIAYGRLPLQVPLVLWRSTSPEVLVPASGCGGRVEPHFLNPENPHNALTVVRCGTHALTEMRIPIFHAQPIRHMIVEEP
jgi:uncharacterized membrane protein